MEDQVTVIVMEESKSSKPIKQRYSFYLFII